MVHHTQPPSTYASSITSGTKEASLHEQAMDFECTPLCYHRGASTDMGNDTSIYYEGFDTFVKQSIDGPVSQQDCTFTNDLCLVMEKYYSSEGERLSEFKELFQSYVGLPIRRVTFNNNFCIGWYWNSILEGKNEVGSTQCDPFKQCAAYYLNSLQSRKGDFIKKCSCPCYLLELMGAQLTISAAVYGELVYLDRLVPPLLLVRQQANSGYMIGLAKTLRALKDALLAIEGYYVSMEPLRQPRFPFLQSISGCDLIYKQVKHKNIFSATYNGANVIVKFCERYGDNVHQLLAAEGLAPNLIHFTKVARFFVVVMDEVQGQCIDEYLRMHSDQSADIGSQLKKAVTAMTSKNFCHGDLRPCNILVQPDGTIKILDFDWAGEHGKATYPFFLNHVDIQWPPGVSDGAKITPEHDSYWVGRYYEE